jgi:hypothetical protein
MQEKLKELLAIRDGNLSMKESQQPLYKDW